MDHFKGGRPRLYGKNQPVKAIAPICTMLSMYRDVYFDNGIPQRAAVELGEFLLGGPRTRNFYKAWFDSNAVGGDTAYDRDFNQDRDWRLRGPDLAKSGVAVLLSASWDEGASVAQLDYYTILQNSYFGRSPFAGMRPGDKVTGRYQIVVGTGPHGCCLWSDDIQLQWYEHWLKGIDTGIGENTSTPIHLVEVGSADQRWANLATYPFVQRYENFFLRRLPRRWLSGVPRGGAADRRPCPEARVSAQGLRLQPSLAHEGVNLTL